MSRRGPSPDGNVPEAGPPLGAEFSIPQLEAMIAVVDEGTFTEAAHALRIAQPSLSRRIHTLEESLGVELFAPAGRGMALTETGRSVAGAARRILDELQELAASVASERALLTGSLRITGLPSLLATRVPGLVGAFHRENPGVKIDVFSADDTDRWVEAVRTGRADIAIGVDQRVPPDLAVIPLRAQEFVAVRPRDGSTEEDGELDRATLCARTLITLPRGTSIRAITDAVYADHDVQPRRVMTTSQRDSLIRLALATDGVTIVPADLARVAGLQDGSVVTLSTTVQRPIGAFYRPGRLRTSALESFIALVHQEP